MYAVVTSHPLSLSSVVACPEGTFGSGCSETCACENEGLCNSVDGSCTCVGGWTGPTCSTRETPTNEDVLVW